MEKKQNLSQQEKKNQNEIMIDLCPACEENLYYNDKFTKRVALIENSEVEGWMCPFCNCQFDLKDNLMYIKDRKNVTGKA